MVGGNNKYDLQTGLARIKNLGQRHRVMFSELLPQLKNILIGAHIYTYCIFIYISDLKVLKLQSILSTCFYLQKFKILMIILILGLGGSLILDY